MSPCSAPLTSRFTTRGGSLLAAIALATSSQACSAKIQAQRVQAVERVAIVEYQATIEDPSAKTPWDAIKDAVENDAEIAGNESYDLFARGLHDEFSWEVMPREQLIEHPAYQKLYDKYQGAGAAAFFNSLDANGIDYRPAGIIKGYSRSQISTSERTELLAALGVDALVTCWMKIDESGKFGIGPYSVTNYRASAQYQLFDETGSIWSEPGATGESSEGVKRIALPLGQQEVGEQGAEKRSFMQALAAAQERLFQRFYEATGLARPARAKPTNEPATQRLTRARPRTRPRPCRPSRSPRPRTRARTRPAWPRAESLARRDALPQWPAWDVSLRHAPSLPCVKLRTQTPMLAIDALPSRLGATSPLLHALLLTRSALKPDMNMMRVSSDMNHECMTRINKTRDHALAHAIATSPLFKGRHQRLVDKDLLHVTAEGDRVEFGRSMIEVMPGRDSEFDAISA
jgi:hypothetical protein